ncbi:MAG: hypothetical protein N2257_06830 [Thermodesulfovibrionales bacterium]|nr:hypothetical protein [Thermodesulfovibrionales bacterium]
MKEPVKGIEDNLILTDFQKPSSGNLENLRSRRYSGLNALSAFYLEHFFRRP